MEYADVGSTIFYGLIKKIAAFTAAELGEMLPEAFLWEGTTQVSFSCAKYTGGWHVYYRSVKFQGKRSVDHYEDGTSEADARAKMLIYLIENNLTGVRR